MPKSGFKSAIRTASPQRIGLFDAPNNPCGLTGDNIGCRGLYGFDFDGGSRCGPKPPLWGAGNRHFGSLRPASLRRHMRSAAPSSPQIFICAPTALRRCPLRSVLADEQPHRSRIAAVSRSERPNRMLYQPLPAVASDPIACSISRPSTSKLSMINIVGREADAERSRVGKERQDRTGQNKQELKNRQNKQKQTKPYLQNKQLISACGSRAGQRMQEEGKYML